MNTNCIYDSHSYYVGFTNIFHAQNNTYTRLSYDWLLGKAVRLSNALIVPTWKTTTQMWSLDKCIVNFNLCICIVTSSRIPSPCSIRWITIKVNDYYIKPRESFFFTKFPCERVKPGQTTRVIPRCINSGKFPRKWKITMGMRKETRSLERIARILHSYTVLLKYNFVHLT